VNSLRQGKRERPPLDETKLQELALRYVGKYATTRAKLRSYLARKVRERGWKDGRAPDFEALASRFAELGYVDDASYALAKSRSLSARGYGKRRLSDKLRVAGVDEHDSEAAKAHADREAVSAALRFAERRRLGPFAAAAGDRDQLGKWTAAMIRAGHSYSLARAIVALQPGAPIDISDLRNHAGLGED
jgi:regulatory protein